jgi:hypothetical protein
MKRSLNPAPFGAAFLAVVFLAPAAWTVLTTGTPAARTAEGAEKKKVALFDSMTRLIPEFRFQGAWLQDAFDYLRQFGAMTIVVDWRRLEEWKIANDTPVNIHEKNISVEDALKKLLGQLGDATHRPAYTTIGDVVVVSTPAGAEAQSAVAKSLAVAQPKAEMKELLNRPMGEANLDGVRLAGALDFVRDAAKLPIDVDWKGLQEAGVDRNAAVSVNLSEIPSGQALCILLGSVDSKKPVGVTVDGDKIHVGPLAAPPKK